MNRRWIAGCCSILLSVGLLAGCAKTPEESLIKQKGEAGLKNYEEGQALGKNTAANENSSSENGGETAALGENTVSKENSSPENEGGTSGQGETGEAQENHGSGENLLRAALNAPEHYQSDVKDETGKLQILTDAVVEIPNTEKVSSVSVSQHSFDQELMDKITDVFFKDATIYSAASYDQMTKEDYRKRIEILKGYVAEGNLDPYHWGTDENGNMAYDIYKQIENMENAYEEAPESRNLQEVHPQYGLEVDYGNGEVEVDDSSFYGVACTPDGKKYNYIMQGYASMPMEVHIARIHEDVDQNSISSPIGYDGMKPYNPNVPEEDEMESVIGLSLEEAKKVADEKAEALDIESMEMVSWEYVLEWSGEEGYSRENQVYAGYEFHYARKINGIPTTYTESFGGALEDMDSEMETWCYERLDITVTKEGIEQVIFINQYDLDGVKTENLNLMSFNEIMKIYEKMMVIQNADVLNYENYRTYRIDRITFGYSRIYEPSSNSTTGLLVPVWDFFGSFETEREDDGQVYEHENTTKYQSYLTINAVDGSIINRELGY